MLDWDGRSPARMPGGREGWEGSAPPAVSLACAHSAAPFLRDSGRQVCRSSQKACGSGKEPEKSRCRTAAPRDGRWFGPEPAGCQPRILRGAPLLLRADRERGRPGGPEHQRASVNGQVSRGDGKSQCAEPGPGGDEPPATPFVLAKRAVAGARTQHSLSGLGHGEPATLPLRIRRKQPEVAKDGRCREIAPSRPFFPARDHRPSRGEQPEAQQVLRASLGAPSVPSWPASLCLLVPPSGAKLSKSLQGKKTLCRLSRGAERAWKFCRGFS